MPAFTGQRHLVARLKKRQRSLRLGQWGGVRGGGQEIEKVKPLLSPWKRGALSYGEGVEWHSDGSCGLMNVGVHSSIRPFIHLTADVH